MFYSLMTKDLSIKKLLTQAFFQMYTYATYSLKFLRNNQFEFAVFKIMTTQTYHFFTLLQIDEYF